MSDIEKLRERVAAAGQHFRLNDEQHQQRDERLERSMTAIDQGVRRMRAEMDRHKLRVEQLNNENADLRGMLDKLLLSIEEAPGDRFDKILHDLDAIVSRLPGSAPADERIPEDGGNAPATPAAVTPESTAPRKPAKTPSKTETTRPARPSKSPLDRVSPEELSIRAIAELWSMESDHSATHVEAELLAAFHDTLKGCSMDTSKDATISRDDLLKFCEKANIDPPKFWAKVA